jgi:hypothetical protein
MANAMVALLIYTVMLLLTSNDFYWDTHRLHLISLRYLFFDELPFRCLT